MIKTHHLGLPRIGANRELKHALEAFWRGQTTETDLRLTGATLREQNGTAEAALDFTTVGDFSFYDHVLDMSVTLGNLPERAGHTDDTLNAYFRVARGRSAQDTACTCTEAGEMTKWFDTNYHYIVPEFAADTEFSLQATRLLDQIAEAKTRNKPIKPVIIGPVTYLWLGKTLDGSNKLALLERLLPSYGELLEALAEAGAEWVQVDEPLLVLDLAPEWKHAFHLAYHHLKASRPNVLLTTYFGSLQNNLQIACELPVAGLHVDALTDRNEVQRLIDWLPAHKVLSLGVIDGRNIWKANLNQLLDWLTPVHDKLKSRLWLAPTCSLLHVPVDLAQEQTLTPAIKDWLAFAVQKLAELDTLARALNTGRNSVANELTNNQTALQRRATSTRIHDPRVQQAVAQVSPDWAQRRSPFATRATAQAHRFNLPHYPTTTIGSFPQTTAIRQARQQFKRGELSASDYQALMEAEITTCVAEQEALGLDVLVHGEPERNDMVEYFGEQLGGFAFTQFGWVQSYGSRCVKPPILYGDVSRPHPMTLAWTRFAQSLTDKPMKGMLTGPVTILNWSFVRNDQPLETTCTQIALAIREEVLDLEKAGVQMIQIDEAALREGLPLRQSAWADYLRWAVDCFRLAANGVRDETQIHTHMCYSEFNDILDAIARMDADVITIESSRSNMDLLEAFQSTRYPNEIGPGVYDIHTPNVPTREGILARLKAAQASLAENRLWVNPDCGLKTRSWEEVRPALHNMVAAARQMRLETQAQATR